MTDEPRKPIELSLGESNERLTGDTSQGHTGDQARSHAGYAGQTGGRQETKPVMGWFAVGFAVLGIVSWGVVFVPLGFVCSIIALFMGQGMWAFIGLALSVVGLFSSPMLLGVLGLGALAAYFGIPV